MPCCCENVYRMCDIPVCDGEQLVLPITIPADGAYTLELEFLDRTLRQTEMFTATNTATFSKDHLNERFTYLGYVLDADGEKLTFTVEGKTYECFEFTTKRVYEYAATES